MANTFLNAQGVEVGKSLCEHDLARDGARDHGQGRDQERDHRAADRRRGRQGVQGRGATRTIPVADVAPDDMILDIGPDSVDGDRRAGSPAARRCSGTARWARSRSSRSTGHQRRGPGRGQADPGRHADDGRRRWRHGGGPGRMPACSSSSPTSRPPAAPSSNGSRARTCRASRHWNGRRSSARYRTATTASG